MTASTSLIIWYKKKRLLNFLTVSQDKCQDTDFQYVALKCLNSQELGKTWEEVQSEDDRELVDDEDE